MLRCLLTLLLGCLMLAPVFGAASTANFITTSQESPGPGLAYNVSYRDQGVLLPTASHPTIARIGVMYSATGAFGGFGKWTRAMAVSWMNDLLPGGIIPGTNISIALLMCDVASDAAHSLSCARAFLRTDIAMVIGPESMLTVTIMPLFEEAQIPVVSPITTLGEAFICDANILAPCTRPSARRFQYLYGTQPLAGDLMRDYLNLMKVQGAKTVAIVKFPDTFNLEVCETVEKGVAFSGLTSVHQSTIAVPYDAADRLDTVAKLAQLDPDLVIYCNRANCTETLDLFRQSRYYPPSLVTVQCVDYPYRTQEDPTGWDGQTFGMTSMKYTMGATGWDARLHGPEYREDPLLGFCNHFIGDDSDHSPRKFQQYFLALSGGLDPTYSHSGIMMSYYMIEAALASANSVVPEQLRSAIGSIYIPTFNGRLSIDSYGLVRSSPVVYYQIGVAGELEIVAPPNAQTSSLIYPIPDYWERAFSNVMFATAVEKAAIVLIVVAQAYMLALLVCMVCTRSHPLIRAMSWKFSALTVVGAQVLLMSIFTWTVNNNEAQCRIRIPMIFIGYSTFLCSIFARVFRLHKIFNTKRLQQVSYPDGKLALIMLIPMSIMWLMFLICVSAFPSHVAEQSPNSSDVATVIRPSLNFTDCSIDGDAQIILYAMLVCSFFLTTVIYYLARKTKHVPAIYNSPMEIVNSLGLFLICFAVAIALVLSGATESNRVADFGVRSIFVFVACCGSIHGLFFDKVWQASLDVFFGIRSEIEGIAAAPANHTVMDAEGGEGSQPPTPIRTNTYAVQNPKTPSFTGKKSRVHPSE